MVHLVKKKKKGKVYLYLQETGRINGRSQRLWQIYLGPEHKFKERSQMVQLPNVETETLEFGFIAALLSVADKLDLVKSIDKATEKRAQGVSVGEHLLFAAINRCIHPVSKAQLKRWFESTILRKLFPKLDSPLDSRSYWTHFRYLDKRNIEQIGENLARNAIETFDISFTNLLFDPTNFFTYINPKHANQTLPKHGHSKEGRHTLNLINFSLFCALDGGIPFLHLVYPGNVHDTTHFKQALKKLQTRVERLSLTPSTITLTFDKGNLSEEAFTYLDKEHFNFIASIRPSTQKDLLQAPPEEFHMGQLPNGKQVGVKETDRSLYGKKRRLIMIYNPKRAKWLQNNYEEKVRAKQQEIEEFFRTRLNSSRWNTKEKVQKKCKAIVGAKKFQKAVEISITEEKGGGRLSMEVSRNQEGMDEHTVTLGKSFLITNRSDLLPLDVVWAYRQQYIVENAFMLLKNPKYLSIRPLYHRTDESILGHCFVCFLGLLLLSLLVRELITKGFSMSVPKLIDILHHIKLTRISIPGRKKDLYKVNTMDDEVKRVYDTLELDRFV